MKRSLLEILVCPRCLPGEYSLEANVRTGSREDIREGSLGCPQCNAVYPIRQGIAFLDPSGAEGLTSQNRYETPPVVASYLWSHYADLLGDDLATDAYNRWAGLMSAGAGLCLDCGAAVGRFAFEMAKKFDFVVGLDNSVAFIQACRELMTGRRLDLALPEEGVLTQAATIILPEAWRTDNLEFIVGDAQALPFKSSAFAALSSLNMVDKLPRPLVHLGEINRLAKNRGAQFLFSDPFSWSTEVAPEQFWLGGVPYGPFAGWGQANISALLEGKIGSLEPVWRVEGRGSVWWRLRTHRNHYEMIRSCYLKASR